MQKYVPCSMCGYGWSHKGSTFCSRCGKALVEPPKGGKGASTSAGSGSGAPPWKQDTRWNYWTKVRPRKPRPVGNGKQDAGQLLDALSSIEGFSESAELKVLREKAAKAETPVLDKHKADAAAALTALAKNEWVRDKPEFKAMLQAAEIKPVPREKTAYATAVHLDFRIGRKTKAVATASEQVEKCKQAVEKAAQELATAQGELVSKTTELDDLKGQREKMRADNARQTLLGVGDGGGRTQAAALLPQGIADNPQYAEQILELQRVLDGIRARAKADDERAAEVQAREVSEAKRARTIDRGTADGVVLVNDDVAFNAMLCDMEALGPAERRSKLWELYKGKGSGKGAKGTKATSRVSEIDEDGMDDEWADSAAAPAQPDQSAPTVSGALGARNTGTGQPTTGRTARERSRSPKPDAKDPAKTKEEV